MTDPVSDWRLTLFDSNIPVKLVERSGVFGGLDDTSSAVEKYLVQSQQLLAFATGMFPPPLVAGNKQRQKTFAMPGIPFLRAKRIKWKALVPGVPVDPFNTDPIAPAGTYGDHVEIDVEYLSSNQEDESDEDPRTFLEISANTTGEFLHGGGGQCYWADVKESTQSNAVQNQDPNPPVTIPVPHTEWNLRWPLINGAWFEEVLIGRLRSRLGAVNSTEFGILFDAAPQTVMFMGYDYNETPVFTGSTVDTLERSLFVEVNMKFVEKHVVDKDGNIRGHNDIWKKGTGWQYLWCGSEDEKNLSQLNPIHTLSNLNDIFATNQGTCTFTWDGTQYVLTRAGCLDNWLCPDAPVGGAGLGVGDEFTANCIAPTG